MNKALELLVQKLFNVFIAHAQKIICTQLFSGMRE